MKRWISVLLLGLVASPAAAQSPLSLELSASGVVPTESLGPADLGTGVGFGANLRYRFLPHLAAYAGWEYHHNRTRELIAGQDIDVEDTGYTLGLRYEHPLAARTAYWLRAGGLVNHIELENENGDLVADSRHGLGWEVGAGLTLPVSPRVSLTPGARYRTLTRDMRIGEGTRSYTLSYVAIGAGLAFSF